MKRLNKTYLLLGSNLGDRKAQLIQARKLVGQHIGQVVKASSIYETQAWGMEGQPDFLNQALEVTTSLSPGDLLAAIFKIEAQLGRLRGKTWEPRTLDIDILFYDALVLKTKDLTIPHPHLHQRNFVLIPMLEIAPYKQHPILKKSIEDLYEESRDDLEVILLDDEADGGKG